MSSWELSELGGMSRGFTQQVSPSPKRGAKNSPFLDEMKKIGNPAAVNKIKDSIERSQHDDELKSLYEQLSPLSRSVVKRVSAGTGDISKDEWKHFCTELKDAGAITQDDYVYTQADVHLIPIGYHDERGNFIKYPESPYFAEQLHYSYVMSQRAAGKMVEVQLPTYRWNGDPMKYLNSWTSMLYDWRSGIARTGMTEDGQRIDDFSPINDQINSCQKVMNLLKELGSF